MCRRRELGRPVSKRSTSWSWKMESLRLTTRKLAAKMARIAGSHMNLFRMTEPEIPAGKLAGLLGKTLVGAIGPVTARKLRGLGVQPDMVPAKYLIH